MFSKLFIKKPIFALVCGVIILLVGLITIPSLPVAQFPQISPTQISITASYTGASAEVVEQTVTNILEAELNGIEGLRYLSSTSSNDGLSTIVATFDASRNEDLAAVDIQNRLAAVTSQLPAEVQRNGVRVAKSSNNIVLGVGLYSEAGEYDDVFLSNYADNYLLDALRKLEGVGNVQIFGERRYAMRVWLDPNRLAARRLIPQDVVAAIQEQNRLVGAGQLGQSPAPAGQQYQFDLEIQGGRLGTVPEFEELVLKVDEQGQIIKLRDVGRVELGAESYNTTVRYRGNQAVGIGIFQRPGSNALDVANRVIAEMEVLSEQFPPGLDYRIAFNTTDYVAASMREVVITLITAIALVIFVIFLFLQDWRTTLVPTLTIPIALIGTFIFIKLFNFSINSLTLFGLTLATGLVVDDAIVVVEDIARLIHEKGMAPKQAAIAAMQELTGAVIATSLVLMAVFIPVAFFPGTTGALYQQFALTIAFSIAISTFIALSLTPSLAGVLLRDRPEPTSALGKVFNQFNRFQNWLRRRYQKILFQLTRMKYVVVSLFTVLLVITAWLYQIVPGAFVPEEDQGYIITLVQAPQGVSMQFTDAVMAQVEAELLKIPEIDGTFAISGFSFGGGSQANSGVIFCPLKPWSERTRPEQTAQGIIGRLFPTFAQITEARVFPVNPPPIQGLSNFGGFQFQLQDRSGRAAIQDLVGAMGQLLGAANQDPALQGVFSTYAANNPKYDLEIKRDFAKAKNINIAQVYGTLQTAFGSTYVNDFDLGQDNYRVYVQMDGLFRDNPADIGQVYTRSDTGEMVSLGQLFTVTPGSGAQTINHYNLLRSIEINGSAAPGVSSGEALQTMERIAQQTLPRSFGYEWAGTALEEIESGGQAPIIFGLGLVFVFLVLAAQYENFLDPAIILLSVPLAICGALTALVLRGFPNDVYCQVGLVMLIGLASKNAILIVEFANHLRGEGLSITKAAIEAARERLRPILMTAISTLSGIFPLTLATGAGAASRQSLGTTVFGGMLVATLLSLFVVPILYILVTYLSESLLGHRLSKDEV
ncbi:efflux RND transporter permease subunit [Picosynechococcus sp. PCC 8807]|uniref:efflux RND transporter permease subunit n=1 Tax=Picosynechococcus sp. PCC 8807 TaxID=195248 RepID=UPI000810C608|nr:efflux RND transporter permease subunit [Picosynechococcus sp. PCC 8807]ANV90063.1 RND transporter [Picosynechococcus sp. PCC 8807]